MTEADVQLFQVEDFPAGIASGTATPRRLAHAHIVYVSASASDTIDLNKYVSGTGTVADIVGITYDTMNNASNSPDSGSAVTWSTAILTTAGDAGAGAGEVGVIFRYT
jgi:hypothetical protein